MKLGWENGKVELIGAKVFFVTLKIVFTQKTFLFETSLKKFGWIETKLKKKIPDEKENFAKI